MRDLGTLPKFKNLFIKGKAKNHVFGPKDFSLLAWWPCVLNFKQPRRQLFSFFSFCTADGDRCSQCNNC